MPTGRSVLLLVPTSEVTNKAHQNKSMHAKKEDVGAGFKWETPLEIRTKGLIFMHCIQMKLSTFLYQVNDIVGSSSDIAPAKLK